MHRGAIIILSQFVGNIMTSSKNRIAIVYPSGRLKPGVFENKEKRLGELSALGLNLTELEPKHDSETGYMAGMPIERAAILCHALTNRKYDVVWAARGGFGATSLIPFLENMLPPALPDKLLVGFSDVSFIGVYLALRFPNFTYVHANHPYDVDFFKTGELERNLLYEIIQGRSILKREYLCEHATGLNSKLIEGVCVPVNLSLAESLAVLPQIKLPKNNILFLEEIGEDANRVVRKLDSLINSRFLDDTCAIVLGTFTDCVDHLGNVFSERRIAEIIYSRTKIPVINQAMFGHDILRHPLVCHSPVKISNRDGKTYLSLSFQRVPELTLVTPFDAKLCRPKSKNVHLSGIGGTGMAAVAGLFKSAGYHVTGSDNPIYPPMSDVIASLGISPQVGYKSENIGQANPDFVILANAISRIGADLKQNDELETLLQLTTPILSFPSALRKFLLTDALNVVVAGTHGKTTTTSLIAHSLTEAGYQPSFLVGGAPKNFDSGFKLASKDLYVLEGDEYDTAFFDKGPKFLHYEPKVALINNIEFDHADIYENVEAIEEEFYRLACITRDRGGIVIANLDDKRVVNVINRSQAPHIGFSLQTKHIGKTAWIVEKIKPLANGFELSLQGPDSLAGSTNVQLFGRHNAANVAATIAVFQAVHLLKKQSSINSQSDLETHLKLFTAENFKSALDSLTTFLGIRRRFELIGIQNDIAVFDDFAHHPTAITTTLEGFRSFAKETKRSGKLIVCFDPRNATMRRRVLQMDLIESLKTADEVYLGKIPVDKRIASEDVLDGETVAKACGTHARYFSDNDLLCETLSKNVTAGDTVVFMSSGAFDNLPRKLFSKLGGKV